MRPLILVVDDEEEQRRYFHRVLTSRAYRVALSPDGTDGFRKACAERPVLVIIDINMPGMDGTDCYRLFKKASVTRDIPILLTTALPLPPGALNLISSGLGGALVLCKHAGLDHFLSVVSSIVEKGLPCELPHESKTTSTEHRFQHAGRNIIVNQRTHRISIDGQELPPLPGRRFDLISELLETEGALSRDELLKRLWDGIDNPNLVDVTILRLRQDLKKVRTIRITKEHDGYVVLFCDPPSHAS